MSDPTTHYDLRADVRRLLDTSGQADPGVIADSIAKGIPDEALRAALRLTLRSYVRQAMAQDRTMVLPTGSPTPAVSWKAQGIRDGWQRALTNRVHVGNAEWKLLGDCTYDELQALAAERETIAAKNQAWARHYRSLAHLLTDHGATTVRDLPAEVLMPALGAVA